MRVGNVTPPLEWSHRFWHLQDILSQKKGQQAMFDAWSTSSKKCLDETGNSEVIRFQITIGQALLDYPELDRVFVKARVEALRSKLS